MSIIFLFLFAFCFLLWCHRLSTPNFGTCSTRNKTNRVFKAKIRKYCWDLRFARLLLEPTDCTIKMNAKIYCIIKTSSWMARKSWLKVFFSKMKLGEKFTSAETSQMAEMCFVGVLNKLFEVQRIRPSPCKIFTNQRKKMKNHEWKFSLNFAFFLSFSLSLEGLEKRFVSWFIVVCRSVKKIWAPRVCGCVGAPPKLHFFLQHSAQKRNQIILLPISTVKEIFPFEFHGAKFI